MVVPLRNSGYEIGRSVAAVITWLCGMNRIHNSTLGRSVNYFLVYVAFQDSLQQILMTKHEKKV